MHNQSSLKVGESLEWHSSSLFMTIQSKCHKVTLNSSEEPATPAVSSFVEWIHIDVDLKVNGSSK